MDTKEKNTYKYHLIVGHKVVHKDITYDLVQREISHQQEFPGSRIKQIGRKTTHESALKWLRSGGRRDYKRSEEITKVKFKYNKEDLMASFEVRIYGLDNNKEVVLLVTYGKNVIAESKELDDNDDLYSRIFNMVKKQIEIKG